jgi:Ca-activated chloride channel family protein
MCGLIEDVWATVAGRRKWLVLSLLPLLASACAAQAQFRVDVRLINVAFSVRDAGGALITNLGQDDFEVSEDGVPQRISFFARATDVPLNLGLIVDFSSSQGNFVKPHHKDLETFLKTVLTPQDRAFLVGFASNPYLLTELTASAKEIMSALQRFENPKNRLAFPMLGQTEIRDRCCNTAFYDAIYDPIVQLLEPVEKGRRAALIFSDGEDNLSAKTEIDAIEAAQNADTVLYSIRYTETRNGRMTARNKYGTSVMQRMARDTGGEEFDARESGLAEDFRRIAEQLHSSYEIAYHTTNPVNDGSFHKIGIRVKQPDLVARAKTGYYAR